jgi:predicted Zn-dependent peptidase
MKNILLCAFFAVLLQGVQAQTIDRSKPPKAGPPPVITFKDPVIFKLPNGLTVLVVEEHKLPEVSASLYIDKGPVTEGAKAGVLDLMGSMLNEGTTVKTKAQFDEAVDLIGSNVGLNSGGGSVSALTRYFPQAFELMAEGLLKPSFPQESFEKLKSQVLTGLKAGERSVKTISGRVVNALAYGSKHPSGEFVTEASVTALTLEDVKQAYKKYITPSRAYLTIAGDITPAAAKSLVMKYFSNWKGSLLQLEKLPQVPNPAKTEIDLIDVPNATQSEITVVNLVYLPLSSPDYFPVLLANQVFGGGADARLFKNLREKRGFTYGAYSNIGSGRFQTSFKAAASVRNEKTDSAVVEFLSEIDRLRNEKISAEELKNAKSVYNGSFALGMEDPTRTAGFASSILLNNLPKDFYRTYLQKINAVTVDDIQRVAKKYFNYANTRVVVVGKQDVIEPALRKIGHPVNLFDKYAVAVTATKKTDAVTTNISAQEVINNYIKAVGGPDALKKVNTITSQGELEVMGQKLPFTMKEMSPNLELQEIRMGDQLVMKNVFDGAGGYIMQMGQKKEFSAEDIAEKQLKKGLFEQMNYQAAGYELKVAGLEKLGTADVYKIIVNLPGGKKATEFYDSRSGMLLKSEKTTKQDGAEITQVAEYSDYKKVGDILLPHVLKLLVQSPAGEQELNFTFTSFKINEGVSAADFK